MTPDPRTQPVAANDRSFDASAISARLLRRWLEIATSRSTRPGQWRRPTDRWIAILVEEIGKSLGASSVQLLAQVGPRWDLISQYGSTATPGAVPIAPTPPAPNDPAFSFAGAWSTLVTMALDSVQPIFREQMVAAAIHRGGEIIDGDWSRLAAGRDVNADSFDSSSSSQLAPAVLVVRFPSASNNPPARSIETVAGIAAILQALDRQQFQLGIASDAAQHLRRLLDLSIRWTQIENTEELLEAIAASSAEMLGAERASIFLWEKKRGKLVARPALGVEGGKLEVDDNVGIVGAVLSTGRAKIWNQSEDSESEINRAIDKRLKFNTRSLVAVPLRSPTGALLGVFEVLNKKLGGFDAGDASRLIDLARHAAAAIQDTETRQRLTSVRDRLLRDAASKYEVIGDSPAIRTLRDTVSRVAKTDLAVLALGENGTGKEVLARSIHFQSSRRDQPFVAVNCAALVESLLESELFGHERGAFTDAVQARPGKFELASGGTLFLDEIGDMSPGGQAKLLRVLEEKIVVRVGGSIPIPVDVRIIAATNQSLRELVATKRFREDLFFRLNVVSFRLPPLRERGDDILTLAEHFLAQFSVQIGRVQPSFSHEAKQALLHYRWPGNVRELRNVMERTSYLSLAETLTEYDLGLTPWDSPMTPTAAGTSTSGAALERRKTTDAIIPLGDATRDFQIEHIQHAIDNQRGNMTTAAESLGLHRSNLYRKMRQLGMKTDEDQD